MSEQNRLPSKQVYCKRCGIYVSKEHMALHMKEMNSDASVREQYTGQIKPNEDYTLCLEHQRMISRSGCPVNRNCGKNYDIEFTEHELDEMSSEEKKQHALPFWGIWLKKSYFKKQFHTGSILIDNKDIPIIDNRLTYKGKTVLMRV